MAKNPQFTVVLAWCFFFVLSLYGFPAIASDDLPIFSPVVPKENRTTLASTESGTISAVDVCDPLKGCYHLQFISLEPSSLFLNVLLHTDVVFYVHTGTGTVSWVTEGDDKPKHLEVARGDVYRIEEGSVLYVHSHPDPTREKLRIHAIFSTLNITNQKDDFVGVYSRISDLVTGFDEKVLQMGFAASEEAVEEIKHAERSPPIVHFAPNKTGKGNWNEVLETLIGARSPIRLINSKKSKKKSKTKAFNVYKESPDFENCNGWSTAVTNEDVHVLTDVGFLMVNLSKGAMMGPHWNPKATEIGIVVQGRGMVQIVCPSRPSGGPFKCKSMRFVVKEGDVFVVPRFHPMAQMSFNNGSFVFVGFSTWVRNNHPQYLAGKWSVLRTIDMDVLAASFGSSNSSTIQKFLSSQDEAVILECTSCAEDEFRIMAEEIDRKREEEEEEARRKEEEEARKREEEARKKEEDEAKKREEEARKKEEEEAKKREEEARRREEEEETRRKQEEEEAKREEEARRKEEEEARKREEEEAKKREEEARKREEEEAKKREEEARRREEEEETRRKQEEEEAKREEESRRKEEEEEARRKQEEEEAKREEEARKREEEEAKKREEEARRREEEEETRRKQEEEEAKREEEARRKEDEEEARRKQEEEEAKEREEEARRRQEEEEEAKKREEEETKRK